MPNTCPLCTPAEHWNPEHALDVKPCEKCKRIFAILTNKTFEAIGARLQQNKIHAKAAAAAFCKLEDPRR